MLVTSDAIARLFTRFICASMYLVRTGDFITLQCCSSTLYISAIVLTLIGVMRSSGVPA